MTAPCDPELSFIMPCYNEAETIPFTIPQLVEAFRERGVRLQLVAVDNGSSDDTGKIIQKLIDDGLPITPHRVELNEGYGKGVLEAIPQCEAPWVGIIPADGQVDADDVVRLYEAVRVTDGRVVGKVRRRFRMDGLLRKVISVAYNGIVFLLWPRLGSIDVNGSPKIIPARALELMQLEHKQWFLDPELMIKAHHLGLRVLEMNVFARMRGNGLSHVRASTCWGFFRQLLAFKFGGRLRRWKRSVAGKAFEAPTPEAPVEA